MTSAQSLPQSTEMRALRQKRQLSVSFPSAFRVTLFRSPVSGPLSCFFWVAWVGVAPSLPEGTEMRALRPP